LNDIRAWTIKDSAALYNIAGWSAGFFRINGKGPTVPKSRERCRKR
jgi:arginine decarboxylase-like protein